MQSIYKLQWVVFTAIVMTSCMLYSSCKKLVDIPAPNNQISDENVYTNDLTAIAVMTGIYTSMSSDGNFTGAESLSVLTGLSADELSVDNDFGTVDQVGHFRNALSANASIGSKLWVQFYSYLYKCNAALEGIENSDALSVPVKHQLTGEAKFLRAFFYFYLTNLFGDVPLAISSDYKVNSLLSRAKKDDVYKQIVADLTDAEEILSSIYMDGSLAPYTSDIERLRPTRWAAKALLARVYLYLGDYENAKIKSAEVINNTGLFDLTTLQDAFIKNNKEAIWQLQPVIIGHNTEDAWTFIIPSNGLDQFHPVYLSNQLLNSFETDDQRKSEWIDSMTVLSATYFFPYKYKSATFNDPVSEYSNVLRLAEQFLIRSEAKARLGDLAGAAADLNAIRTRAGLNSTLALTEEEILMAIQHERQVELFTEWGDRWLNLKRTNKVDDIMGLTTPIKANGSPWQSYQSFYPVPLSDIESDPNLVQNEGY